MGAILPMKWFRNRGTTEPGWLAVAIGERSLNFVHGCYGANGKSAIERCGSRDLDGDPQHIERAARELGFARYRCTTLLAPGEYQLLLVEAPNVPPTELRSAIRWRVKDLLDYHVEDATLDVLDIPPDPARGPRAHFMYVIAARNEAVEACIARFETAHIPLKVIEIEETAQRNIGALYETEGRGLGLLHFGPRSGLLTVNFRTELYLARRIEIGMDQILSAQEHAREELFGRVALEVQRTFDHVERQFPFVPLDRLMLGPEPAQSGLGEHLAGNLGFPVSQVRLGEALRFAPQATLDAAGEWRLFHLVGAALRHENKAL